MTNYTSFDTLLKAASTMQAELVQLRREQELLLNGTARQAKIIRTLTERNSVLEAEIATSNYQIELIKKQGRKARSKFRAMKKAYSDARNHLGQALSRAERAEREVSVRQYVSPEAERRIAHTQRENFYLRREVEGLRRQAEMVAKSLHLLRQF